jgi:eukaryotic-like serine/threonine-protein kinase
MSEELPPIHPERDIAWARAALQTGRESSRASEAPLKPDTRFGDYELLERLGQGATATVYRARQVSLGRVVALKLMSDGDLEKEADVQRFRFGAEAAAELNHPNIAPIYEVGEQDGVPFFTMRLFEGGTLAEALGRLQKEQVDAVALVAKVARAVHYAHERGVLHRDLKPANIVLDERDEPHVVDFGFAKRLDERALSSKPSMVVGTVPYMAPEQAAGAARSLTFASDIYALGVILYELLTGEVPYQGLELAELFERLKSNERVRSPRALDANIDRELEYVCLKCLEKDPARRYPTAARMAQDLERWLRFEPITIPTEGSLARTVRWCRTYPALATLIAGTLCVLAATAGVALSIAREQEQVLLSWVLHANTYAAEAKAGQVLAQLRELSDPVARCAADPRIEDLLASHEAPTHPARADRLLIECGAKTLFDSVALVDRSGVERARLPQRTVALPADEILARDYFIGAERLGKSGYRRVHVGRVLRSESEHGERQVPVSAPVYDADNQWLGMVNVTVDLNAFLESLHMVDSGPQIAVLAGERERESGDAPGNQREGVMVLLHGKREETMGAPASGPWLKELRRLKEKARGRDALRFSEPNLALADNPVAYPISAFGKRWLSGFAPVGYTGYALVVQTRYDSALEVPLRALLRLLGWSGGIFVCGVSTVLLLAWTLGKRTRRARA